MATGEKYVDSLTLAAKHRYFAKIVVIAGIDPYEIPKILWSNNLDDVPELCYMNIVNYFVSLCTGRVLNAYKLFIAGWVREVQSYRPDESTNIVVTGKVLHSQRLNEKPLVPWFIVSEDGPIITAHCTCMAHVAALAFAVDAFVRARERPTCTGVKAYWKIPQGVKGVKPKSAAEIDFSSAKSKRSHLDAFIVDDSAAALASSALKPFPEVPAPTVDELSKLFAKLKATNHLISACGSAWGIGR